MELNRGGWRLGVPQRLSETRDRRVPVMHREARVGLWAHGRGEAEWTTSAQYAIDEFYVKRLLQLNELILQDDAEEGTVVLHARRPTA